MAMRTRRMNSEVSMNSEATRLQVACVVCTPSSSCVHRGVSHLQDVCVVWHPVFKLRAYGGTPFSNWVRSGASHRPEIGFTGCRLTRLQFACLVRLQACTCAVRKQHGWHIWYMHLLLRWSRHPPPRSDPCLNKDKKRLLKVLQN